MVQLGLYKAVLLKIAAFHPRIATNLNVPWMWFSPGVAMALIDVAAGRSISGVLEFAARRRSLLLIMAAAFVTATALVGAAGWLLLSAAVAIESDPPDAILYVNGQHMGRTSMFLMGWGALTWQLRVEAPGYLPWSATTQLEPRGTTRIFAQLAAIPGRLEIDSAPTGAAVWIDDEDAGTTPLVLEGLTPGWRRIAVTAPDYEGWRSRIEIAAGRTTTERIALAPLPAHLAVVSAGGEASVWIDDQHRGYAPLETHVEPGEHLVRVEADGYRVWERQFSLRPNETRTVNLSLQRPWPDPAKTPTRILAVVVENQEDARPQSGLDRANVVYEALAEGGITRFLALYAGEVPEMVGPVRSARHYYVNWAHEYNAPLVHVGASPLAYEALATTKTGSLDEIRGDPGFWRLPARRAPHNLYTNLADAKAILEARQVAPAGSFGGLEFKRAAARRDGSEVAHVTIKYGSWDYTTEWRYDPYWNEYVRWMDGAPHVDAGSGEQIRATNVLALSVESWLIEHDREGRLEFAQVGKGRLVALIDGVAVEGSWAKPAIGAPTEYRDASGAPLRLNTGPTWIQIVPIEGAVILDPN
jgi:hypothetical protein